MNSTDFARDQIRERIITGEYKPNQRLTEDQIMDELNATLKKEEGLAKETISRMPVRQALIELEGEGLVTIVPRFGTIVRTVSPDEVRQLFHSRAALEEFVVVQLASLKTGRADLTAATEHNNRLRQLAVRMRELEPNVPADDRRTLLREFVQVDTEFHQALAEAARFPHLYAEILRLRRKLYTYGFQNLELNSASMLQTAQEHQDLLDAIGGRLDETRSTMSNFRPDLAEVRAAIRRHMREAARRWHIEPLAYDAPRKGQVYRDIVFDTPDSPPWGKHPDIPLRDLFSMRVTLELGVVQRLAVVPTISLEVAEFLNIQMKDIAHRVLAAGGDPTHDDLAKFVDLDIGFHATLAFLSGMFFAEEAIIHIWRRFYPRAAAKLTKQRMKDVVLEHEDILSAIRPVRGRAGDPQQVTDKLFTHFLNAVQHTYRGGAEPDHEAVPADFVESLIAVLRPHHQAVQPKAQPSNARGAKRRARSK